MPRLPAGIEGSFANDGGLRRNGTTCASRQASSAKMSAPDAMSARASRVRWATVLAASGGLAAPPSPSFALSVQETLLHPVPAGAPVGAQGKARPAGD